MDGNLMKRTGLTAIAVVLAGCVAASAQSSGEAHTFSVAGRPGSVKIVEMDGRSYVAVEDLARLTQGSLSFQGTVTLLTVPGWGQAAPAAVSTIKNGFSREFLAAGIEQMSTLREWRIAIVDMIQNNTPVPEDWIAGLRRQADQKLAMAATARSTSDDRSLYQLLAGVSANVRTFSDKYLNLRRQLQLVRPADIENDRLDQQNVACGHSLQSMIADNQFRDEPACLEAR